MDEATLLDACIDGNRKSRSEFLEKYSRLIYSYIRRIVDIKGNQHARSHLDDIFHDLFCSLFADDAKKLRSFQSRNGCTFASWLRQVTINFTIDYLRSLRVTLSLDSPGENQNFAEVLRDTARSAADSVMDQERLQKLRECVEKLDTYARYFLEMHINQGICLDELREHLKMSRGAIDMFKSRLMERLRDCFKTQGYTDD
jgi:RNA polymerase sigma factor (sigma-70 family)